ncbi:hypothetical protein BDN72DRAFT_873447 [Pluteus cervinus]|uniref:Uncharacterized protein n=1 Tax=Pluteus cervinus TaxID=181527 RepID=A0ACD3BIP9_9AGAR|nr:hypothetical protein BDN72DRAFT_873447 [Pluteus cervinus]
MPFPTRNALEAMKRVDLQRLCKEYGVKANLKTEALIDLLLDTQSGPVPQSQQTAPLRRSVSTRAPSRELTGRMSSVIIHDIPEDEPDITNAEPVMEAAGVPPPPPSTKQTDIPVAPRTRKAKETQTRLGVGKPVIAGGRGPRAVTKSISVSKGKRGKSGRSIQPSEATIMEEPEPQGTSTQDTQPSPTEIPAEETLAAPDADMPPASSSDIETYVSNAMRPLLEQIQALRVELTQMSNIQMELQRLKTQVADMSGLQTKVEQLTVEVRELRSRPPSAPSSDSEASRTDQPSTPKPNRPLTRKPFGPGGVGLPSTFQRMPNAVAGPSHIPSATHSGITDSALGKRSRMSPLDASEEQLVEGTSSDPRPLKKRLKTGEAGVDEGNYTRRTYAESNLTQEKHTVLKASRFTVFSGAEEEDPAELPAAPTLSESEVGSSRQIRSTANAPENQQPMGFSFLPIEATPAHNMYLPPFPYPEPPQSPTPEGSSTVPRAGQEERTDVFHTFGLPAPGRQRPAGASTPEIDEDPVDALALIRGTSSLGRKREVSSNEVAAGLGLTAFFGTASMTEPPHVKRTMYGTELDGDKRFGDFGVEGVANGFWAAGGK